MDKSHNLCSDLSLLQFSSYQTFPLPLQRLLYLRRTAANSGKSFPHLTQPDTTSPKLTTPNQTLPVRTSPNPSSPHPTLPNLTAPLPKLIYQPVWLSSFPLLHQTTNTVYASLRSPVSLPTLRSLPYTRPLLVPTPMANERFLLLSRS